MLLSLFSGQSGKIIFRQNRSITQQRLFFEARINMPFFLREMPRTAMGLRIEPLWFESPIGHYIFLHVLLRTGMATNKIDSNSRPLETMKGYIIMPLRLNHHCVSAVLAEDVRSIYTYSRRPLTNNTARGCRANANARESESFLAPGGGSCFLECFLFERHAGDEAA